jgi:mono/diheme cytochrome c family protein/peroxiredoxin
MEPTSSNVPPAKRGSGGLVLAAVLGVAVLVLVAWGGWWLFNRMAEPAPTSVRDSNPPPPHSDALVRGETVYRAHCLGCHGAQGRGDGPQGTALTKPPHDFTLGLRCGHNVDAVRRATADGVPDTAMRGFGQALPPDDLTAVTVYVLKLADALHPPLKQAGLEPVALADVAPELKLVDTDGNATTLEQRRGRLLLIVFWETTSTPCLEKLPQLARLAEEFRGQDVEVLAVCVNNADAETVRKIAAERLKTLPAYRDVDGSARRRYDISTVPRVCLIDRAGLLLAAGAGPADWSGPEIRELLKFLLERSAGK